MRGDNLKKNMKKHERGNEENFITGGLYDGKEKIMLKLMDSK